MKEGTGPKAHPGDLVTIRLESLLDATTGEEMSLSAADKKQNFKIPLQKASKRSYRSKPAAPSMVMNMKLEIL